jgi:aldehyde:ferredoxin oxidoreductase
VGERINNLAKAFNVKAGLTRDDDTMPDRMMIEPLKDGASKGQLISQADLKLMLDGITKQEVGMSRRVFQPRRNSKS